MDPADIANCRNHHELGSTTNKTGDIQGYIRTRSDKDYCMIVAIDRCRFLYDRCMFCCPVCGL